MNDRSFNTSSLLLDWVLQRGREVLAVRMSRAGAHYRISISSPGQKTRLVARVCEGGSSALRLHAALVSEFRDAGWRTIAYR